MLFKSVLDGYVLGVGKGAVSIEITEEQYTLLDGILKNKPVARGGYEYKLLDSTYEWIEFEIPPMPEPDVDSDTALNELEEVIDDDKR